MSRVSRTKASRARELAADPTRDPASATRPDDSAAAAVKTHLKALYDKFDLAAVPPAEKRSRLAAFALGAGLVTRRDLG